MRRITAKFACLLTLLGSGLAQAAAVRETTERYTSGDKEVAIECFAPKTKGKHPAVLILYGSGGLEYGSGAVYRTAARSLAGKGYVTLLPHLFERTDHVVGERPKDGEPEAWQEAVKDAVEFAAARDDVDPERFGLFGYSMGAGMAFAQSLRDPRIKAIVSCAGPAFIRSSAKFPPTLLLHGEKDQGTPVDRLKEFEASLKSRDIPCSLHVYPGAGHNWEPSRFADASRRAATFFDQYVKKAQPAKSPPERGERPQGEGR